MPDDTPQSGERVARAHVVNHTSVAFWCPGCSGAHMVSVAGPTAWGWNRSETSPTFTPSVLVRAKQWSPEYDFHKPSHHVEPGGDTVCHSFVTDGRIQFLGDCTHDLAGQTVDLPAWDDNERRPG